MKIDDKVWALCYMVDGSTEVVQGTVVGKGVLYIHVGYKESDGVARSMYHKRYHEVFLTKEEALSSVKKIDIRKESEGDVRMIKVVDKFDLSILEKYGFVERGTGWVLVCDVNSTTIAFDKRTKLIQGWCYDEDEVYVGDSIVLSPIIFDVLYDLIKDGVVEK